MSAGTIEPVPVGVAVAAPVLEAAGLRTTYRSAAGATFDAVRGVGFTLAPGRSYGLVGESGSGKSSVVRALLGLIRKPNSVTADVLRFAGELDLLSASPARLRALRGAEIGYVGQNPFGALHPVLTVGEQYHQFLRAHGRTRRRAESRKLAAAVLADLGLPDPEAVLAGHAGQLSGGMAQRVVIGFGTVLDPKLVIADEPTTALDVTVQKQVLDLLADRTTGAGRSLLLVTHDLSVVAQYCDEVIVMRKGHVVETGPVAAVFPRPLHPYTTALLASVPRAGSAPRPLPATAVSAPEGGCDFAGLCPHVEQTCHEERPELAAHDAGRAAACHHALADAGRAGR